MTKLNWLESKPWTMYGFCQGQKKEHLNRMREIQFRDTSADTESESNTILTESKPEVQETLICSKSREGAAESSGAPRFSNTSVDVQYIVITNEMRETGNYCKQTWETKSDIQKVYSVVVKVSSKGTAHESLRIPVSNLKTLCGLLIQIKGKNWLTRIIL